MEKCTEGIGVIRTATSFTQQARTGQWTIVQPVADHAVEVLASVRKPPVGNNIFRRKRDSSGEGDEEMDEKVCFQFLV